MCACVCANVCVCARALARVCVCVRACEEGEGGEKEDAYVLMD